MLRTFDEMLSSVVTQEMERAGVKVCKRTQVSIQRLKIKESINLRTTNPSWINMLSFYHCFPYSGGSLSLASVTPEVSLIVLEMYKHSIQIH